jgi:hypothetical protein
MPIDRDFLHIHAKNPQVQQAASTKGPGYVLIANNQDSCGIAALDIGVSN